MPTIKSTAPRSRGVRNFDTVAVMRAPAGELADGFVVSATGFAPGHRYDGTAYLALSDLKKLHKALGVLIAEAGG